MAKTLLLLVAGFVGFLPASAAMITVGGGCTLSDAITAANTDSATGGCTAGSGADTIELTVGLTLMAGLPLVTTDITVNGNGFTIQRSTTAPSFRFFQVQSTGNLTITNTTISGGAVPGSYGGAIYNFGTVTLTNTRLSGNSARLGGAIINLGTVTLTDTTLSGNSADNGGGIYNNDGSVTMSHSTLSGNSARLGGGIFTWGYSWGAETLTLSNCTLSGNSASERGGGIFNQTSPVTLTNTTLSGNSADSSGGIDCLDTRGTVTLTNSVAAKGPTGSNCAGPIADGGNNFANDTSCGSVPNTLTGLDPILADNGGPTQTHALLAASTAIDAAGACGLATDQRGVLRNDGFCDSGAFEFVPEVPAITQWGMFWLVAFLSFGPFVTRLFRRRPSAAP